MDREILHRDRHRGLNDKVVLVPPFYPAVGKLEEHLIGPLDIVNEFLIRGFHVPELGDKPGRLGVALVGGQEGIDMKAGLCFAYPLHHGAHFVVKRNKPLLSVTPHLYLAARTQDTKGIRYLLENFVHLGEVILVRLGKVAVQIFSLQNNFIHNEKSIFSSGL